MTIARIPDKPGIIFRVDKDAFEPIGPADWYRLIHQSGLPLRVQHFLSALVTYARPAADGLWTCFPGLRDVAHRLGVSGYKNGSEHGYSLRQTRRLFRLTLGSNVLQFRQRRGDSHHFFLDSRDLIKLAYAEEASWQAYKRADEDDIPEASRAKPVDGPFWRPRHRAIDGETPEQVEGVARTLVGALIEAPTAADLGAFALDSVKFWRQLGRPPVDQLAEDLRRVLAAARAGCRADPIAYLRGIDNKGNRWGRFIADHPSYMFSKRGVKRWAETRQAGLVHAAHGPCGCLVHTTPGMKAAVNWQAVAELERAEQARRRAAQAREAELAEQEAAIAVPSSADVVPSAADVVDRMIRFEGVDKHRPRFHAAGLAHVWSEATRTVPTLAALVRGVELDDDHGSVIIHAVDELAFERLTGIAGERNLVRALGHVRARVVLRSQGPPE